MSPACDVHMESYDTVPQLHSISTHNDRVHMIMLRCTSAGDNNNRNNHDNSRLSRFDQAVRGGQHTLQ